MRRRLPNTNNRFLGHSQVVTCVQTKESPLTIKRKLFTGQEDLISEGAAYSQTLDYFCGLGIPQSEALSGVLAEGKVATHYAIYESANSAEGN